MSSLLKSSAEADQTTIDIVNGYIHDNQSLLPYQENQYFLIPPLVTHLIMAYYFDPEYFAIDLNDYDISQDRKTITKTDNTWYKSMHGNVVIQSTVAAIYEWSFKLLHLRSNLSIGVTSDIDCEFNDRFWDNTNCSNYAAMYCGFKGSKGKGDGTYDFDANDGDIVYMTLDLVQKEIRFMVNDKNLGAAYTDIDVGEDIKYKMAIDAHYATSKVTLISFTSI